MTVYVGESGNVELIRDSGDTIAGTVKVSSVDAAKGMFSFNFQSSAFVTGDFVEFRSNVALSFVSGWTYTRGNWFVNIDQLGGLRLYTTYSNAIAGTSTGRVALAAPASDIAISCTILNAMPRLLGQIVSYELSTDREAVDTTGLGDEFRNQYSTLITGSGSIDCIFDYATAGDTEIAVYLHNLILRQQFGSDFKANLYILREGQAEGTNAENDAVWHEINGVMTNAAVKCTATNIIESRFTFVTTGEIKLRVQTTTWADLLLNAGGDRLVLSTADGDILELGEEL